MPNQDITLTRSSLTALDRCDRSFVMSMFWHGLDNDSLAGRDRASQNVNSTLSDARRAYFMNTSDIKTYVRETSGITRINASSTDPHESVRETWDAICDDDPAIITDGYLEGAGLIVGFSVMIVHSNGKWDVYHQSSKHADLSNARTRHSTRSKMFSDALPLMYVLSECYADEVRSFGVIAADKHYLTPYPDPITHDIIVDPDDFIDVEYFDIFDPDIRERMLEKMSELDRIQERISYDPFWIPEAEMGTQCNVPYGCEFTDYCSRKLKETRPDDISFYLSNRDVKHLRRINIDTMEQVIELQYEYPDLTGIPDENGSTFELSEDALYDLDMYIENKMKVEEAVSSFT